MWFYALYKIIQTHIRYLKYYSLNKYINKRKNILPLNNAVNDAYLYFSYICTRNSGGLGLGGLIVEIPGNKHNSANKVQHPKPKGEALPKDARDHWDDGFRNSYYSERARTELLRRGISLK